MKARSKNKTSISFPIHTCTHTPKSRLNAKRQKCNVTHKYRAFSQASQSRVTLLLIHIKNARFVHTFPSLQVKGKETVCMNLLVNETPSKYLRWCIGKLSKMSKLAGNK